MSQQSLAVALPLRGLPENSNRALPLRLALGIGHERASNFYSRSHCIKDCDKSSLGIALPEGIYDLDTLCKSSRSLPAVKVGWNAG